jgi:predicted secreted Zn-dependent protease
LCRRDQHDKDVASARRVGRLVLMAPAIVLGLLTLLLASRSHLRKARDLDVMATAPATSGSPLQDDATGGAKAASTVWMNPAQHGPTPDSPAMVVGNPEGRVAVTTSTEEYTVSGDSVREILGSIDRVAPLGQGAKRHAGYTDWHVDYHYSYERSYQGCRARPVSTDVKITYQMPHWATEPAARDSLRIEWNRFIAALWVHEKGHGEHGVLAAQEIKAKLEGLPPEKDCEAADTRARAVAQEVLRRYADADVDYDRQTEGGRMQGARLSNP